MYVILAAYWKNKLFEIAAKLGVGVSKAKHSKTLLAKQVHFAPFLGDFGEVAFEEAGAVEAFKAPGEVDFAEDDEVAADEEADEAVEELPALNFEAPGENGFEVPPLVGVAALEVPAFEPPTAEVPPALE